MDKKSLVGLVIGLVIFGLAGTANFGVTFDIAFNTLTLNYNKYFTVMDKFSYANISEVPVLAALWLFGSALIGIIGLIRKIG